MKKGVLSSEEIYFLNFIFNPVLRTLQKNETVVQLRKKQSDVLALLCEKYPDPVFHSEFLTEVWGGGYVTSQSIAQMIRSLRISLGDETKSIIVTIPKLGYQLSAQPYREEPEPDTGIFKSGLPEDIEVENISFSTKPLININPVSTTSEPVIPYAVRRTLPVRKRLSAHTLFFSAIIALFFSLICVAMTARSNPLSFIKDKMSPTKRPLSNIVVPVNNNFLYCCRTTDRVTCDNKSDL